ncbi:MAG TPA: alpha/beta hydrolase [Kineosporiaceae bacterium]
MNATRTVEIHGHARAYRLLGSGPTALLLLHGIGSDGATWDTVAPRLAQRFTVIVPDLLGHGRSAKPRADYSIGGYANGMRDLLGVLDVERVTVIGHSFGGGVATQFAYQFPERTDRLVLVAGGGLGPEVSVVLRALTLPGVGAALRLTQVAPLRWTLRALRAAAARVVPPALATDLGEALVIHDALRDPATRAAFLHVLRHVVDREGQLITMRDRAYLTQGLPTLIVWGEQDHVLPVAHAQVAAEVMPGSRSVVLPGVGHFPHREAPEEFVRVVTEFVEATRPNRWDARRWRRLLQARSAASSGSPDPPSSVYATRPRAVRT